MAKQPRTVPLFSRLLALGGWKAWGAGVLLFLTFAGVMAGMRGLQQLAGGRHFDVFSDALAAVAVFLAGSLWLRDRIDEDEQAKLADEEPDFRDVVGGFAAASRESVDSAANARAFMAAIDGALGPAYQVITVKQVDGGYKALARLGNVPAQREQDVAVIPLTVAEKVVGRLHLGARRDGRDYRPGDYGLLDNMGQSLALAIRNAQLFEELAGQERLKRELEIAFDVQMGLLPKSLPTLAGASLAASCLPALEVGGDFYDFVTIDQHRQGVLVGDVAGKGVPASLMMAVALTLFRALAPGIPSPAQTLGRLNKLIYRNRPSNKIFVAAVYLIYDSRDGSVLIANAGHPPPMLDDAPVAIKGLPLGVSLKTSYKEARVELAPGGTLAIYSDGLEDLENEAGNSFGPEGVEALLRHVAGLPAPEALAAMREALSLFAGKAPQPDDTTIAIVRRDL